MAKIKIVDEDGNPAEMNLYKRALEILIEKNTNEDGEKPDWLLKVEMVFNWGDKIVVMIDKIGQGEIPDTDIFKDYLTMNMMNMNEFTQGLMGMNEFAENVMPTSDDMLI